MKSCEVNHLRFAERAALRLRSLFTAVGLVLLPIAPSASAQTASFVAPENYPKRPPIFGEAAYGLQLGLCLESESPDGSTPLSAYFFLRNSGTNTVSIFRGGPDFLTFEGTSADGTRAALIDSPASKILIRNNFLLSPPYSIKPGGEAFLKASLVRYLRVPKPGRYFFLASAKMRISTAVPPTEATLEQMELISGAAEFDVPASLVYTNTGKHPSSAKLMPANAYFINPTNARTPEDALWIQRVNERTTNFLKERAPQVLGSVTQSTNPASAAPPRGSPASADSPQSVDSERSRWWLAGVVAICVAVIGFVLLRRR